MNDLTYNERADASKHQAMTVRMIADAEAFQDFLTELKPVAKHTVNAANIARDLGQSFDEYYLPGDTDMAKAYFNQHYADVLKMTFEIFKWIKSAARRLPDKCDKMADIWPEVQLLRFAGNLIELPSQTEKQVSHEMTPYNYVFNKLRSVKNELEKRLLEMNEWDEEVRSSIKSEFERMEKWLAAEKGKL